MTDVRDACPLCGAARIPALDRYAAAHLRRCRDCGFVFAGLRPSVEETREQYEGYGVAATASPITDARYEELLDEFARYRQTGRILDVGCGEGRFLDVAAARGWTVHGSESNAGAVARNRARGIAMSFSPLAPGDLPTAAFDVITAFEVAEHLADPAGEAAVIAALLRPGGLLYVTTPNFASLSRRLLGPRWSVIEYPEHLNYFTARTLRRWLGDAGLRNVAVTSSGLSVGRLRAGVGQATSHAAVDERARAAIERRGALRTAKRVVNATLAALGAGDTLKGRFERPTPAATSE